MAVLHRSFSANATHVLAAAAVAVTFTVCLLLGLFSSSANAHEIRPTIATLELAEDGSFTLTLSLNLESLIAAVGPEHRDSASSPNAKAYDRLRHLPPEDLSAAFAGFAEVFRKGIVLSDSRNAAADLVPEGVLIPPVGDISVQRTSTVTFKGTVPLGAESLRWRFDEAFGPSAIRAKPPSGDIFFSEYVLGGEKSGPVNLDGIVRQSRLAIFADYIQVGYQHIVPNGLDHILFVIGLYLLSPRLKPILWQVTCFTVAHTVTLALGTLGIVRIPATVIEPLIALSIVYVALENLRTDHLTRWRPFVVFLFGLLHGLGFAGILTEIGLAPGNFLVGLVSFNLGVELGQLTVVAGCFLAVGIWFANKSWYRSLITLPASFAISAVAAFWFLERVT